MNHLKQNNKKKKLYNSIQFILLALLPIIGVVTIFFYAFMYVKKDADFTQKQLKGLHFIKQIEESVFNIQRLRGLSEIKNCECRKNKKAVTDQIRNLQSKIQSQFILLLSKLPQNIDPMIKTNLQKFLNNFQKDIAGADFKLLSSAISQLMYFSNELSYRFNLKLEPTLKPYIMVENSVNLLPKIIEYNGQIRAKASGVFKDKLTQDQKAHIRVQLEKIDERLKEVKFNHKMICSHNEYAKVEDAFKKMIKAQQEIVTTVNKEFLNTQTIHHSGIKIYDVITANLELIINLQRVNFTALHEVLTQRHEKKTFLLKVILFIGIASLLFIVYVNCLFYKENKKLIETVEKMSMTDGLTQLHNRRAFDMIFDQYLKLIQRENRSLAFIIMDIDFFKQYNDTYGHQAGDETLKKVSNCLQDHLKRDMDEVFRLGGEEFGVLSLDMDAKSAFEFAQSLRESVEKLQIKHQGNSASKFVTLSVGICIIDPKQKGNEAHYYKLADDALYKAKKSGRNKVVINN